jgi:hypothetical protein
VSVQDGMLHHAWSDDDSDAADRHAWSSDDSDRQSRHAWSSESDAASSEPEGQREKTNAELFVDEMVGLHLSRVLNARDFCVLMFYASFYMEECKELGKRPGLPSGHYHRLLNAKLPVYRDSAPEYELNLVCSQSPQPGRHSVEFPVLVLQEELDSEMQAISDWEDKLNAAIDNEDFPASYDTHPVVQSATRPVVPVALFIDALPYSNVDSLIGFWIINLLTEARHLVIALRKSLLCTCGCKGWCTFWGIFFYIHWCLSVAASGVIADERHDGQPWRDSDSARRVRAGAIYIVLG